MKKTHVWYVIELLMARCPYCRKQIETQGIWITKGDIVTCPNCSKKFELGQ